jgi:hypothetical protein
LRRVIGVHLKDLRFQKRHEQIDEKQGRRDAADPINGIHGIPLEFLEERDERE